MKYIDQLEVMAHVLSPLLFIHWTVVFYSNAAELEIILLNK